MRPSHLIPRFFAIAMIGIILTACQAVTIDSAELSAQAMKERIKEQMKAPDRHRFDQPKDAGRKPVEYFDFLGLKPGMVAADLGSGAGYSFEIMAAAVGPTGKVFGHNLPRIMRVQNGYFERTINERLANNRLPNAQHFVANIESVQFPEPLDFVHWGLNLHDHVNNDAAFAGQILEHIYNMLKPGGILGISDHIGVAGKDNKALHRIELNKAVALIEAAGFIIEARSELLYNPEDDHSLNVYDDNIRPHTDRFLIRARKRL